MHVFLLFWRKKLSILLITASLVLCALWTWTILDTNNALAADGHLLNDLTAKSADDPHKHVFILQKLISQANRVLRYQRQQQNLHNPRTDVGAQQLTQTVLVIPAAAHNSKTERSSSLVRFVKPTKSPILPVPEASAQTLALVARRRSQSLSVRERNVAFEEFNSNNNNMDYERFISSAERQTQYEHELQRMGVPVIAGIGPESAYVPNERLVHLDLKGAPPKLSFLKSLLPTLKSLGATGLLIEYEDMFPYNGVLQPLSARNAYKAEELRDFLETAAALGLTIMPLVQTFGHMEFALKLQGFQHMRELPEGPQSICPSQQDSLTFIQHMLTQVIEFHLNLSVNKSFIEGAGIGAAPPSEWPVKFTHIHIGCDEVYRMGECEKCRKRLRNEIFLTHVTTVANFVRSRWPQLQVVIWDDMLRAMTLSEMQHSHIGSYVEPMIWVYVNDIYHFIQPQLWDIYSKVFATAWAASAFKGAFGESLMIPPLQRHLENNIRWLAVIAKEGGRFAKGFKGLALTGWQRYDHFAVLCELLPTGIPSMITALSTVSKGYFSTNPHDNDLLRVLECAFQPDSRRSGHPWIELNANSHHGQLFQSCNYLGSFVYKYALRLNDKLVEIQNYLQHTQVRSAWLSDYNVLHNFSSPLRIRGLTANTPALINELTAFAREAQEVLYDIYDEHTVAEYIEQNIYPTVVALRQQLERAERLLQQRVWPQRPLPNAHEMLQLGLVPYNQSSQYQQQQQQQQQQL